MMEGSIQSLGERIDLVVRGHPAIVALHNNPVGAVVGRQLNYPTAGHPLRELQDVPHRGAAEAVQALVLIPNYTKVATFFCELEKEWDS